MERITVSEAEARLGHRLELAAQGEAVIDEATRKTHEH
jgi:hypothetical protein